MCDEGFKIPTTGYGADGKAHAFPAKEEKYKAISIVCHECFESFWQRIPCYDLDDSGKIIPQKISIAFIADGHEFCSQTCLDKYIEKIKIKELKELEQQKFEEIERMAWEIYQKMYIAGLNNNQAYAKHLPIIRQAAWERAEEFYSFAKQKQEEASDV